MDERLAARDRDHRRARLLDRAERLVDRHAPAQLALGVLDLAAARAREVALEQRLELHDQRELLAARDALLREIGADSDALTERNGQTSVLPGCDRSGQLEADSLTRRRTLDDFGLAERLQRAQHALHERLGRRGARGQADAARAGEPGEIDRALVVDEVRGGA